MGFLEMLGVPYASCDVTASAVGMDKYLMKAAMKQAGLPVLDALQFTGKAYALDSDGVMDQIEGKFPYPLIVKPVNLGSSVGISKAGDRGGLRQALDLSLIHISLFIMFTSKTSSVLNKIVYFALSLIHI